MGKNIKTRTYVVAKLGVLAALSIVLALLIHIPIIPAASFLEYDPADIPIILGTFALGPWWGLLLTGIVCVIQGLTVSASSGLYGIIMHFVATGCYVLVAGLIYNRKKTKKRAIVAMACGILSMTAIMIPANLLITPAFTGWPLEAVKPLILSAIVPFNLIKAGINSVITFIVYKKVSPILHKHS